MEGKEELTGASTLAALPSTGYVCILTHDARILGSME